MKQSQKTGAQIYKEIADLKQEIKELDEAIKMVGNEIGAGSTAFKHLKDLFTTKRHEVSILEQARYTVPAEAPDFFEPPIFRNEEHC
jgi:hypothetical protein